MAQGARGSEIGLLYQYIQPVLRELPNLISLYHNYQDIVQLILELLFECTNGPEPVLRGFTQARSFSYNNCHEKIIFIFIIILFF